MRDVPAHAQMPQFWQASPRHQRSFPSLPPPPANLQPLLLLQFHSKMERRLPAYNTRVKLPMAQKADMYYGE